MCKRILINILFGASLIGISIYGMWGYLPEAFSRTTRWQARDTFFWKIPLIVGIWIIYTNLKELYENRKKDIDK